MQYADCFEKIVLVSSSVTDTLFINSIERELEDQKL